MKFHVGLVWMDMKQYAIRLIHPLVKENVHMEHYSSCSTLVGDFERRNDIYKCSTQPL